MPDDVVKRGWNTALSDIHLRWFFAQNRGHSVDFGFAKKSAASGQHFVQNRAHAENVATMIDGLAPELFR